MERNGQSEANCTSNDNSKHLAVPFTLNNRGIACQGCNTLGCGHLETNSPKHHKYRKREDCFTFRTCCSLVCNANFVDKSVEQEANYKGNRRGEEEAVENFEDTRAVKGIRVAGVYSIKPILRKSSIDGNGEG